MAVRYLMNIILVAAFLTALNLLVVNKTLSTYNAKVLMLVGVNVILAVSLNVVVILSLIIPYASISSAHTRHSSISFFKFWSIIIPLINNIGTIINFIDI